MSHDGKTIYAKLARMQAEGATPRAREHAMIALAADAGLNSDALRARVRRYCKKNGLAYPHMRAVSA